MIFEHLVFLGKVDIRVTPGISVVLIYVITLRGIHGDETLGPVCIYTIKQSFGSLRLLECDI